VAERLGWGILGTGNIARQFAAGIRVSRSGSLIAIGSRTSASASEFAKAFAVPHAFGNYADVLRTPGVDAVYNALPNSMHHEWTIAALNAGKHVLCEKPLASDANQAQEMIDVAKRMGRVLVEAFMYRSHPQTLAVLDALKSGAIGELKLIRTSFCFRTMRTDGNIRFSRELAGGALMDIGCYCINFSRLFAGQEPSQISVAGKLHESGIDELASGTLTFPNGIVASFTCGMTLQADNTAYLCGTEGFIAIPVPWKPPARGAGYVIARSTPPRMDAAGRAQPAPPPAERITIDCEGDLYGNEADDFAATIAGKQPPRISCEDSLGNMRVLDTMRRQLGIVK
jgi:predicted dehydrogenase